MSDFESDRPEWPAAEPRPAPRPSTALSVVLVGAENEICAFSPGAAELLGLAADDLGANLLDRLSAPFPLQPGDFSQARAGTGIQREMRDPSGNTYLVDVAPLTAATPRNPPTDRRATLPHHREEPAGRLVVSFASLNELVQQRSRSERLARLVDASPEMVAEMDGALRVRTWNRGAEDLLGHPSGAVLGTPLRNLIAPSHRDRFDTLCRRALAGVTAYADSIRAVTAGGNELTLLLSMTSVPDGPDGTSVACFGRDVTLRRQMEAELREREERLLDLYDHAPDLHASIDPQSGRVTECNQTLLDALGLHRGEVIGRSAARLCTADSVAELERSMERIRDDEVRDVRISLRTSDGSSLAASLNMSARINEQGQLRSCRAVWRDVRKLEQTEAELREEVRRRERFLAMLSHELRNPLNAVAAASAVLERKLDADAQPLVTTLTRQTSHLRRLLDDLLDVSRVTQNKLALNVTTIDLRDSVRAALEATAPFAEEHHVDVESELPCEPLWVNGDSDRLQQVASNLLNNAIKFAEPGAGRVRVTLRCAEEQAELRVVDNGPGVAGALKDSVFDLFVQSEATLDRSQGGLGVGLTLVRSLVGHHGGRVEIESGDALGGACFLVRLPMVPAPAEDTTDSLADADLLALKVLVVEDLAGSRQALVALLEMDGHTVEAAEDGVTAMEIAQRLVPDLLICDIGLPGLDGYEVIERLRSDETFAGMKAIALTGYGTPEDIDEARRAGFDDHLTKPLRPERLDAVLRGLFASRPT